MLSKNCPNLFADNKYNMGNPIENIQTIIEEECESELYSETCQRPIQIIERQLIYLELHNCHKIKF